MTYPETLDFLYQQLPMFQRQGAPAFKKDLTNTHALLDFLDRPEKRFRSIHVGGTNGKGSVSNLLAATFQTAGYRTGLYTSPHYLDFRERIRVDGQMISEAAVVDFVEQLRPVIATVQPSFFELTVAMAFWYFAEQKVDMAVVEVGLGGRLDSTNVLLPELCVITNISYDHQQFLGDTLPEIAREKAGIIKPEVPIVIGQRQPEVTSVFQQTAQDRGSTIEFANDHFQAALLSENIQTSLFRISQDGQVRWPTLAVNLHGPYQGFNIQTALAALHRWQRTTGQHLSDSIIESAFAEVRQRTGFLGRWQVLGQHPLLLVDSAHNEAGIQWALRGLEQLQYQQLHFVLGIVNDKDPSKLFPFLPKAARYYFAKADIPRGLPAAQLAEMARSYHLEGLPYPSVAAAFTAARNTATAADLVFVGGSIFTVAEVLKVASGPF